MHRCAAHLTVRHIFFWRYRKLPYICPINNEQQHTTMNTQANIISYCPAISDERLAELLPEVPEGAMTQFYGHVSATLKGYGTWSVTVEIDINGATKKMFFTTHDEEFVQKLRGHDDYSEEEQNEALDTALAMAIDKNDIEDAILEAAEATED